MSIKFYNVRPIIEHFDHDKKKVAKEEMLKSLLTKEVQRGQNRKSQLQVGWSVPSPRDKEHLLRAGMTKFDNFLTM